MIKPNLHTLSENTLINISEKIQEVIMAHIDFRNNAMSFLGSDEDVVLNDHTNCQLALWIKEVDDMRLFSTRDIVDLKGCHFVYHEIISKIVTTKNIDPFLFEQLGLAQHTIFNLLLELSKKLLETKFHFDPLTGLLNRTAITESVAIILDKQLREPNKKAYIVMCDIDNFKSINDTYGHNTGDFVLARIATIFKDSVRKYDLVSRWGGEEFLIILDGITAEQAFKKIENVRKLIENAIIATENNGDISITCSFGVSELSNIGLLGSLAIADKRLYEAKNSGRNKTVGD